MSTRSWQVVKAAALVFILVWSASAQDADNPDRRIAPARGFLASQTYRFSDLETVNMTNGGLTLRIPLATLPAGPGGDSHGAVLHYNSKYWESITTYGLDGQHFQDVSGAPGGGWRLAFDYELEAVSFENATNADPCQPGTTGNLFELRLNRPDGGEHKLHWNRAPFMPTGCPAGVYRRDQVNLDGATNGQVWYSVDGSFLRLEIEAGPDWPNNNWTLYEPDGSRVVYAASTSITTRYDRNGNWVKWGVGTDGGDPVEKLEDDYGHSVTVNHKVACPNPGGPPCDEVKEFRYAGDSAPLIWTVYYTNVFSGAGLTCRNNFKPPDTLGPLGSPPLVASRVELPARTRPDGASYTPMFQFEYGATYKELSRITLPSGAQAQYSWALDGTSDTFACSRILANALTQKSVSGPGIATETTTYGFELDPYTDVIWSSGVTAPDGGTTGHEFNPVGFRYGNGPYAGNITRTTRPDGSQLWSSWETNSPPNCVAGYGKANTYVAWEYETAPGSSNIIKTRKYDTDRNGNRTAVYERSWASWNGADPASWDATGTLVGTTTTEYKVTVPAAGSPDSSPNLYSETTAPHVLALPYIVTVSDGTTVAEKKRYEYDELDTGNLTEVNLWDQDAAAWRGWWHEYDGQGRLTRKLDPDNKEVTWSYGQCGGFRLSGKTVPAIGATSYVFDCGLGQLTSSTAPNSRVNSYTYDRLGRLLTVNEGGLRKQRYAYDDRDLWILERSDIDAAGDEKGASVYYEDSLGRERLRRTLESQPASDAAAVVESGAAIRVETRYETNSTRNAVKASNPYRATDTDGLGWTVTLRDPMGRSCAVETYAGTAEPGAGTCANAGSGHGGRTETTYSAAALANPTAYATIQTVRELGDPDRKSTRAFDALGRLNRVIEDPDGAAAPTLYTYDAAGRLTDVNQSGRTRHFGYGTTGWLTSATNPESGAISYAYTPAGRLLKRTDGRGVIFCQGALNGSTCTAGFDGAGRPLQASRRNGAQPVNVANYTYQFEQLQQVTNSAASVEYGYDLLGRVQLRSQTVDGTPYQASVTAWKPAGPQTMVLPSGRTLTFVYDGVGRVKSLSGTKDSQQRQYVTNASWAAHGGLKSLPLGNTLTETWSWNYRLQPVSVTAGTVFSLGYAYCSGGAVVCATNNGNLVEQTIGHANLKQSYTYDGFGRLHSASERATGAPPPDAWRHRYDYDVWGNRWVTAEAGPALDPFTPQSSGWYDANNRLTGAPSAAYDAAGNQTQIGGYAFSYDEENRVKTSTINGQVTTYYYDGEGRRVKKVTPARTVVYAYGIDEEVAAEYDTNPQGGGAGVEYVLVDHLGSTRTLTGETGAVTRREDFEPFGETLWAGMAGRGAPPYQAPPDAGQTGPRFTGTERDSETGLDYFGARYMSSPQGRFTSVDPSLDFSKTIPDPQRWNRYAYALNNPLLYVDPDGADSLIAPRFRIGNASARKWRSTGFVDYLGFLAIGAGEGFREVPYKKSRSWNTPGLFFKGHELHPESEDELEPTSSVGGRESFEAYDVDISIALRFGENASGLLVAKIEFAETERPSIASMDWRPEQTSKGTFIRGLSPNTTYRDVDIDSSALRGLSLEALGAVMTAAAAGSQGRDLSRQSLYRAIWMAAAEEQRRRKDAERQRKEEH